MNLTGFLLASSFLVMLTAPNFSEGGWITLIVTAAFAGLVFLTHRHYRRTTRELKRLDELAGKIVARFPKAMFFGGQLVFAKETRLTRLLHNFTVFSLPRRFFRKNMPFVVIPVQV